MCDNAPKSVFKMDFDMNEILPCKVCNGAALKGKANIDIEMVVRITHSLRLDFNINFERI